MMPVARRVGAVCAGVVSALVLLELGLRCISSPNLPPLPHIERVGDSGEIITRRQIEEGVSVAHFSAGGARLTGYDPIAGAPTVVILGDSYVVARAVGDRETMGAHLERLSRAAGLPLNVRQYGWLGASPAQYLLSEEAIRSRWRPANVVIPLSDNDLDLRALVDAPPRLRVLPSGDLKIIGVSASLAPDPDVDWSIATLARYRWFNLRLRAPIWLRRRFPISASAGIGAGETAPDSLEVAELPRAVVRNLSRAYGPNLSLVYLAEVGLSGGEGTTKIEQRLLDACREEHVQCASTRAAMIAERRQGRLAHGNLTYAINNGHLNDTGDSIVASVVWSMLERPLASAQRADQH
jgi:hypothetical protein